MHVDQVLAGVPKADRCACAPGTGGGGGGVGGLLARILGRR
ncbi:hypothetical protein [Kitasatospora purpeofusca]|nr:hypothetical protein [Kitasatospora purpeofusca]